MPTTFYVIVHNDTGKYVSGINGQGFPIFNEDLNSAEWSYSERIVNDYITANNLANVKTKSEGGNHPPKPPISA